MLRVLHSRKMVRQRTGKLSSALPPPRLTSAGLFFINSSAALNAQRAAPCQQLQQSDYGP